MSFVMFFYSKGKESLKKNIFFLALPKMGGRGPAHIYYYTLFNSEFPSISQYCIFNWPPQQLFFYSLFSFFSKSASLTLWSMLKAGEVMVTASRWSHASCPPPLSASCTNSNITNSPKQTRPTHFAMTQHQRPNDLPIQQAPPDLVILMVTSQWSTFSIPLNRK